MNNYQDHFSEEVLSASPVGLICLLHRGILDSIRAARTALANGEILARSRAISKSQSILGELARSLDETQPLSGQLLHLYGYMIERLNEANLQQTAEPLNEVDALCHTLLEAWLTIADQPGAAPYDFAPCSAAPVESFAAGISA